MVKGLAEALVIVLCDSTCDSLMWVTVAEQNEIVVIDKSTRPLSGK